MYYKRQMEEEYYKQEPPVKDLKNDTTDKPTTSGVQTSTQVLGREVSKA